MSATNSTENPITPEAVSVAVSAALEAIAQAPDAQALKQVRSQHVGEGSPIAKLNAKMREVPKELKKEAGKLVGSARGEINQAFTAREEELAAAEEAARLEAETVDVTAAPTRERLGARHPLTMLRDRVSDIFVGMGWDVVDGPELESEWYNFDALNFDPDHPAREMQDTFFVEPVDRHLLLRTHTSPLQMRSMIERGAPLYILAPGRTFRTDELDATHTPVFMQFEGLAIDKNLTMAHLRGTLEHFAKAMFGEEAKIRLRNNFFPFTEPSAEMDIWHPLAKGGPRWIEWGGCGMVHPNLLKAAGLDPEEYQGFAFGMGIERTLMFRNELTDMHDIVEGDVRFSEQFGMVI
ncbi:phenylalanine--tRNA ligase subunit alpha [Gulosibacter chungangensis]|uniref:Phenylalanine--tRNA ligase alpha subunit n=1 Tax=Gulosibacter chungangensis TaxID=979746 RepID=A0A7J5B8R2_9MICO|nr:phenylalanine--tRNA ligase subunit alpha [Gulosibacter chungangensis]KAB1641850.1 phenylalanine--tRNA ligase subunit alpha [Gulosibacter chungangensis]